MRNLNDFNVYREMYAEMFLYGQTGNSEHGVFNIPYTDSEILFRVIASTGEGWEHVSVSLQDRCPTWDEMDYIKRIFFEDDEIAVQFHVLKSEHVNNHPYCLHLWRPLNQVLPQPPKYMV